MLLPKVEYPPTAHGVHKLVFASRPLPGAHDDVSKTHSLDPICPSVQYPLWHGVHRILGSMEAFVKLLGAQSMHALVPLKSVYFPSSQLIQAAAPKPGANDPLSHMEQSVAPELGW